MIIVQCFKLQMKAHWKLNFFLLISRYFKPIYITAFLQCNNVSRIIIKNFANYKMHINHINTHTYIYIYIYIVVGSILAFLHNLQKRSDFPWIQWDLLGAARMREKLQYLGLFPPGHFTPWLFPPGKVVHTALCTTDK